MRPLLRDADSSFNLITILHVTTTPILDPTRPEVNCVSVARIWESRERPHLLTCSRQLSKNTAQPDRPSGPFSKRTLLWYTLCRPLLAIAARSVMFDQAENRLYAQKGILAFLVADQP